WVAGMESGGLSSSVLAAQRHSPWFPLHLLGDSYVTGSLPPCQAKDKVAASRTGAVENSQRIDHLVSGVPDRIVRTLSSPARPPARSYLRSSATRLSFTVPSSLPAARSRQSGEKATGRIRNRDGRLRTSTRSATSYTRTPSAQAQASKSLSGERASRYMVPFLMSVALSCLFPAGSHRLRRTVSPRPSSPVGLAL